MREDHLAALDPFLAPIPNRLKDTFRLNLLDPSAAQRAIQGPARTAGVLFTDEAATQLIDDLRRTLAQRPDGTSEPVLGPYIEPVQLQVVCLRLWEQLFSQPTPDRQPEITLADVAGVGDVDRALADYYVERIRSVAAVAGVRERAIRDWFDRQLITSDRRRGQVIKQPSASSRLGNDAIDRLIDAHLVRAEERRGATWFELAHDRLIDPILHDNTAWRKANLSIFQDRAEVWASHDRPDDLLLEGTTLAEAAAWAAAHDDELTADERDFLIACKEQEQAKQSRRRLRLAAALLVVLSIVAAVVAGFFFIRAQQNNVRAEQNARISRVLQLAALARQESAQRPQRSQLLALEAVNTAQENDPVKPAAVENLRAMLGLVGGSPLRGHTGNVRTVTFSPDGCWLATASDDGTARLWRTGERELIALACATTGRNLSLEEWRQFIGTDATYRKICTDLPRHPSVYRDMLARGQIDQARSAYAEDQQRDPTLEPMAIWLVKLAGDISAEDMDTALAIYAAALQADPALSGAAFASLNTLCANGTVPRYAAAVLEICDRAVGLDSADGNIRFNRGIVRARLGQRAGAIEDLEVFLPWADEHPDPEGNVAKAEQWIAELQQGRDPLERAPSQPTN